MSINLNSLARVHSSICWQKSRLNWLKEDDANSKNFHGIMCSRRRANAITMINVNGVQVEGVQHIHSVVFTHFAHDFKSPRVERPGVEGLNFSKLSVAYAGQITCPFYLEEVKKVAWD
jgi:hypothetical protein